MRARGSQKSAKIDAASSAVPDVLGPGLRIVFCGINPGRFSAAAAAHFANPRNDFWRLLHAARFTPRAYEPGEQFGLLELGIGITNAAFRTTKGSGDLRRGDFAGSRERLERLARELEPKWIGFVGKEAYRGTFDERAELGLQERTLGKTRLFVLPSTSPANAAVGWGEREQWFCELAGRATGKPLRPAVRALMLDTGGRVLLTRFDWPHKSVWAPPGGGIEKGETPEQAIRREIAEETGLDEFDLGPCIWVRDHWFADMEGWGGQSERIHVVRVSPFEPDPRLDLAAEHIGEIRWWTLDEIDAPEALFAPRRLPELVHDLLDHGPPSEPIDVGV